MSKNIKKLVLRSTTGVLFFATSCACGYMLTPTRKRNIDLGNKALPNAEEVEPSMPENFMRFVKRLNEDTGILVARCIDGLLNLCNSTRYRRMYVCRYESSALCDELTDLYGVALCNNRFGRSTYVLSNRNHDLLGQFYSFDRISF